MLRYSVQYTDLTHRNYTRCASLKFMLSADDTIWMLWTWRFSLCLLSFITLLWNGRTRWQRVVPWIASWLLCPRTPQAVWVSKEPMVCSDLKEIPSISFPGCQSCAVLYAILSRLSLWPTCVLQYLFTWGLQGIPRLGPDVSLSPICSYVRWHVNHCLTSPEHTSEPATKCTNDKDNSV